MSGCRMLGLVFAFVGGLLTLLLLYHACGFALGHNYDYLARKRTHNGKKCILLAISLFILYHLPYKDWGIFDVNDHPSSHAADR